MAKNNKSAENVEKENVELTKKESVEIVDKKEKAMAIWQKVKKPVTLAGVFLLGGFAGYKLSDIKHRKSNSSVEEPLSEYDYVEVDDDTVEE